MKKIVALLTICIFVFTFNACSLLRKPLDHKTGFLNYLEETESYIRQEEWKKAFNSLEKTQKAWKELKPFIQIDIDHDYVNDIEDNIVMLKGYIDAQDKGNALAIVLLIRENWNDMGEM